MSFTISIICLLLHNSQNITVMLIHFDLLDKLYLRIANNLRHHGWRQLVLHFTFSSRLCTMKMEQFDTIKNHHVSIYFLSVGRALFLTKPGFLRNGNLPELKGRVAIKPRYAYVINRQGADESPLVLVIHPFQQPPFSCFNNLFSFWGPFEIAKLIYFRAIFIKKTKKNQALIKS